MAIDLKEWEDSQPKREVKLETNSDYIYEIIDTNNEKSIKIHKYIGNKKELNVPSEINGLKITNIGEYAFVNCGKIQAEEDYCSGTVFDFANTPHTSITKIEIPNTVTTIDRFAFYQCADLSEIKIPNSVTKAGQHLFTECNSLTNIVLPCSIDALAFSMFFDCKNLKTVKLENGIKTLDIWVFAHCENLSEIEIPESVGFISWGAFWDCKSLSDEFRKSII
jgi:hypothetical protein